MFYDEAKIQVNAGRGGDGAMSFRRESLVPLGGPDGGNGGRGGNVILIVNAKMNTLQHFQYQRKFNADDGRNGANKQQTGRSGKPLYIQVPPGTVLRETSTNALVGDLTTPGQQMIVARGGKGGRGSATYATSTNQAPRMAENGAPGESFEFTLELKLIADIGFVGLPNAGKSTLLAALTAAKPKIANYPFTTLQPNLGVALVDRFRTVVLADIPGLIEGASEGIGLGHEFLRHIERTRVLVHLLDGMSEDPIKDFHTVNAELAAFGHGLMDKPQVIAMTKMDLPDAQAAFELFIAHSPELPSELREHGVMAISSATGQGVRELLGKAVQVLDELPPIDPPPAPATEFVLDVTNNTFEIQREPDGFRVLSPLLERKVEITRWDLPEAVQRFQRTLEASGIGPELEKLGIQQGEMVYIGDYELEWGDQP